MEIKEIWKPIVNLPGYVISNEGNIKSIDRKVINSRSLKPYVKKGKILSPSFNRGYKIIFIKGKSFKVHRLVASAFLENPLKLPCVNHKNGNRSDNAVKNLEWASYSGNNIHAYRELNRKHPMKGVFGGAHPSAKKVKCSTLDLIFNSVTEAANILDCDASTIIKVCKGIESYTKGFYFHWV